MGFKYDGKLYHLTDGPNAYEAAKDGGSVYFFTFGAYGDTVILSYASAGYGGIGDALEEAAAVLKDEGWVGHFSEPEYAEAAQELGLDVEDLDDDQENAVREAAEADLTYTESGWILSYEWGVNDVRPPDGLYAAGVVHWIKEHPDWIDDSDDEVAAVLAQVGATDKQIKAALAALPPEDD